MISIDHIFYIVAVQLHNIIIRNYIVYAIEIIVKAKRMGRVGSGFPEIYVITSLFIITKYISI